MDRAKKFIYRETGLVLLAMGLVALFHMLFISLSGKGLLADNVYNSYVLQACTWLRGSLDLGQDYPWLELAIYEGKYYVSFPPLPSYLLLPLAAVFGENAPDGLLAFASLLVGTAYGVLLARHFRLGAPASVLLPVFLYCGNNLLQVTVDGWVWFLAQNLAFTLTLGSFYHAARGAKGLAALFLVAAVGCRPFQVLYTPVACWLLLYAQGSGKPNWKRLFWQEDWRLLPAVALGGSYLVLNQLRFGNPFEFGHNFLPEFVNSQHGQFSLSYLANNLPSLWRMPTVDPETGRWVFPMFNGSNIFLVNPILILALAAGAWAGYIRLKAGTPLKPEHWLKLGVPLLFIFHGLMLCAHKTMGGAHFGNRYFVDLLPTVYLCLCGALAAGNKGPAVVRWVLWGLAGALFLLGLYVNFTGTLEFYNGL